MPPRIVVETNVRYAGLRSSNGASFQILEAIWSGKVTLLLSQTVLTEYEEILLFNSSVLTLSVSDIDMVLNHLASVAHRAELASPWTPLLDDPDDEAFLKLAAAGHADCIVTHNLRDFEPATRAGFKILAPPQFLATIKT